MSKVKIYNIIDFVNPNVVIPVKSLEKLLPKSSNLQVYGYTLWYGTLVSKALEY